MGSFDSRTIALLKRISQDRRGSTAGIALGSSPGRLRSGGAGRLGPATTRALTGEGGLSGVAAGSASAGRLGAAAPIPAGTLVRSPAEKLANPERLNLDRRSLIACPLLEGEERLRLLNYQNNSIRAIDNLVGLPNLIFLDLYNNQISRISGLHTVPTLRVLMLGKNLVERIEGLEPVRRLDVLDLHCNNISRLEGLSHLNALRVLNLAGNALGELNSDCLNGLSSLIELNLRRNRLARVPALTGVPSLQRLFLSSNLIAETTDVQPLSSAASLVELALDGNPIARLVNYRELVIGICCNLRHLDLRRLSDEERARAVNGVADAPCVAAAAPSQSEVDSAQMSSAPASPQVATLQEDDRTHAIRAACHSWRIRMEREADRSVTIQLGAEAPDGTQRWVVEVNELDQPSSDTFGLLSVKRPLSLEVIGQPPDRGTLGLNGRSMKLISASFQYVPMSWVLAEAAPLLGQLRALRLSCNNLNSPSEVLALRVLPELRSLRIESADNPFVDSAHFRSVAISALPELVSLNGTTVTVAERKRATALWSRLHRIYDLAADWQSLLAPCAHRLATGNSPPGQSSASRIRNDASARLFIRRVVGHGYSINEKMMRLNVLWPELLRKYDERVELELESREALMRRYKAVVYGDGERPQGGNSGTEAERSLSPLRRRTIS